MSSSSSSDSDLYDSDYEDPEDPECPLCKKRIIPRPWLLSRLVHEDSSTCDFLVCNKCHGKLLAESQQDTPTCPEHKTKKLEMTDDYCEVCFSVPNGTKWSIYETEEYDTKMYATDEIPGHESGREHRICWRCYNDLGYKAFRHKKDLLCPIKSCPEYGDVIEEFDGQDECCCGMWTHGGGCCCTMDFNPED